MYENSSELAESKLLLLYILKTLKQPISNTQLTELILEQNLLNYFTLQQYLSELEASAFIEYHEVSGKNLLAITEKGENVLSLFKDRVSPSKTNIINSYIKEKIDSIKKELTIQSDYTLGKNDSFIVDIKALEDEVPLLDLQLAVPTKKQAIYLCNKWKENPSKIYNDIISLLFNEDNELKS